MRERFPVIVRGGGDLATGTIYQLHQAGFPVLVLETETPSAIRRYVAFSEAIYEGTWCVEGVTAQKITHWQEAKEVLAAGNIPVLSDPRLNILSQLSPHVLIDAILAKRNLGTSIHMADTVIALGPGFSAGKDAHFVIETQRGHHLGRVITEGSAAPDTGVPGIIAGFGKERIIHAPTEGILRHHSQIGDLVRKGQIIASIGQTPVTATLDGVLRGLLREGYLVPKGFKIADIDPRENEQKNCYTISDKARCIAGGVLLGILMRNKGSWI